jgi:hypothetical protein
MKYTLRSVLILLVWFGQGCSSDKAYILQPQVWQDVEVMVEVRPSVPRVGMNEFLVVATQKNRRPAFDMVVSLKTQHDTRWEQSIQDGHSGVYRRAIRLQDPVNDVLMVRLERGEQRGELLFPMAKTVSSKSKQQAK